MNIVILRSAIEDLRRGREFYGRREAWLGDYFQESLYADIESLRLYAGIHCRSHGYFRKLSGRFPFAIYYELVGEEIRIRAVLDCRNDPKWIRARLKG